MAKIFRSVEAKLKGREFGVGAACCYFVNRWLQTRRHEQLNLSSPDHDKLHEINLALAADGYYVWENFLDAATCDQWRRLFDGALQKFPELVHPAAPDDLRIHGIENIFQEFGLLADSKLLSSVASCHLGVDARTAFVLGARLNHSESNIGSGGGWHRDSNFPQVKAMVYLSDVDVKHGPFQLISKSHRLFPFIRDNFLAKQVYEHVRWKEEDIALILNKTGTARLKTFTGHQGTMIIFDSSTLHRGAPILQGYRYAVTSYFYQLSAINRDLYDHFRPVAGHLTEQSSCRANGFLTNL